MSYSLLPIPEKAKHQPIPEKAKQDTFTVNFSFIIGFSLSCGVLILGFKLQNILVLLSFIMMLIAYISWFAYLISVWVKKESVIGFLIEWSIVTIFAFTILGLSVSYISHKGWLQ